MTSTQLHKFLSFLMKQNYVVWAPFEEGKDVFIRQVEDPEKVKIISQLPLYSFKHFLVSDKEILFNYRGDKLKECKTRVLPQVIFGVSVVDLKALLLWNHVFEKDPYYQERYQNTLIIGHSCSPTGVCNFFNEKYEEDILEHLQFDIFLAKQKGGLGVFSGSKNGQKVLADFGYSNYTHIEFAGPIREEGPDPLMIKYRDKLKVTYNQKLWEELGKRCIECGKCSVVCPTCFCFDIRDRTALPPGKGKRERCWTSCFYNEFSEVAGPSPVAPDHQFMTSTEEKIHFWYYHKFVRIPEELSFMGCVGCGRCVHVCPAGIDIKKVLKAL